MKKQYNKPQVSFESFALSASIAGGCAETLVNFSAGQSCQIYGGQGEPATCYFYDNGYQLFLSNDMCEATPADMNLPDLCYDVPISTLRAFIS